ncbi:MAG: metallophosphoesterase [Clostridia bacterium]|nr:metallophosphoesterase [Clostridia bacterium]
MKKLISIILSILLVFSVSAIAFADGGQTPAEKAHLTFDDKGNFRVLIFADIQDDCFLSFASAAFMRRSVKTYKPDLIVLTGDNISGQPTDLMSIAAYSEVMGVFQALGVPVAVVFGNHDDQNKAPEKEKLMEVINSFSVSISYDEGPDIYGCGTYNVPIYKSADSDEVCFNLWMFDSNTYDEERGGYDYVHEDQIQWYIDKSNELKKANGGEPVPSIVFQHIIVNEIFDALDEVDQGTEGAIEYGGKYYVLPDTAAEGSILGEHPCPGTYNAGQFDAMVAQGDVIAMDFGHDHTNSFVVPYKGIDLINTATCGFHSYGNRETRGARVIDISSDGTYKTFTYTYDELYAGNPFMLFMPVLKDLIDKIGDWFDELGDSVKGMFN